MTISGLLPKNMRRRIHVYMWRRIHVYVWRRIHVYMWRRIHVYMWRRIPFMTISGLLPKKAGFQRHRSATLPTSTEPTRWDMP